MECLLGSLFYAVGKPIVEKSLKLLPEAAMGVLSNRADALLCGGVRKGWKAIRDRGTADPVNHDLQRAARRAYLRATLALAEQADERAMPVLIQSEIKALDRLAPLAPRWPSAGLSPRMATSGERDQAQRLLSTL